MNLLDENYPRDQLQVVEGWRIRFRQIGHEISRLGVKDPEIIPLLHRYRNVTFFTMDWDFFKARLCHATYCLVWLNVQADDAAYFTRRFLQHPRFKTRAQRLGTVTRVHHDGIDFWKRNNAALQHAAWPTA